MKALNLTDFRRLKLFLFALCVSASASFEARASQVVVLEGPMESEITRMSKIMRAQHTIDAEYFSIDHDTISISALALMRDAAIRGVSRIRIIVDSLNNKMSQSLMYALMNNLPAEARGRIEIREFNRFSLLHPFCYTRRMHDKMLLIDGQTLIVGDRNVANGYFDQPDIGKNGVPKPIYEGLDAMVVGGEATAEAAHFFEQRWNSRDVKPVQLSITSDSLDPASCAPQNVQDSFQCEEARKKTADQVSSFMAEMEESISRMYGEEYRKALANVDQALAAQSFESSRVDFIHDSVTDQKLCKGKSEAHNIGDQLYKAILENTQSSLLIATPYLTVTPKMEQLVRELKAKNPLVRIRILTNSIESNDVPAAHAGFLATKKKLEDLGVLIYEFRKYDVENKILKTMHAKVVLMDDVKAFIGSYNWDFRSEQLNSEVGVLVELTGDEKLQATQDIRTRLSTFIHSSFSYGKRTNSVELNKDASPEPDLTTENLDQVLQLIQKRDQSVQMWNKILKIPVIGDLMMKQF